MGVRRGKGTYWFEDGLPYVQIGTFDDAGATGDGVEWQHDEGGSLVANAALAAEGPGGGGRSRLPRTTLSQAAPPSHSHGRAGAYATP